MVGKLLGLQINRWLRNNKRQEFDCLIGFLPFVLVARC